MAALCPASFGRLLVGRGSSEISGWIRSHSIRQEFVRFETISPNLGLSRHPPCAASSAHTGMPPRPGGAQTAPERVRARVSAEDASRRPAEDGVVAPAARNADTPGAGQLAAEAVRTRDVVHEKEFRKIRARMPKSRTLPRETPFLKTRLAHPPASSEEAAISPTLPQLE